MKNVPAERLPGLIGHELRNPLAAATTGAMLLREMVDADDPRSPILDGVLHELDRVAGLLDSWLRLGRGTGVVTSPVSIDDLARSVASRHGAELVGPPSGATVAGDRGLLERALDNLLENARQAGAQRIRVAVQTLGDALDVHVEDDGCGVPPDHVERIFTAGWSGRGGNGLGLHGVATTVAAHGGRIRCVPLTRGTRFTITLPRVTERGASA